MSSYKHFTMAEREKSMVMLGQGHGVRAIARALGRSPSSVSRELKRNRNKDGSYSASTAERRYHTRRKNCGRKPMLLSDGEMRRYVENKLQMCWSPDEIAGRAKLENKRRVNTRQFLDQKWGTSSPVMMRDAEFGMIRLRAYGIYAFRVANPTVFLKEVFGTAAYMTTEGVAGQVKRTLVSGLSDAIAQSKIPALDLAANYDELSQYALQTLAPRIEGLGLKLESFVIENISLPDEVEKAIDKKTSMGVVDDLNQYTQYQAAEALHDAANNQGGAGAMAGLGMGAAMAQMMQSAMQQPAAAAPAAAPAGDTKFCPECGAKILRSYKFCPECGTKQN